MDCNEKRKDVRKWASGRQTRQRDRRGPFVYQPDRYWMTPGTNPRVSCAECRGYAACCRLQAPTDSICHLILHFDEDWGCGMGL